MTISRLFAAALCLALVSLVSTGAQAATLKIATLSPEGSAWMRLLREAGAQVTEETEDRVKFKFYPGGVMGNDKKVLRKMRIGQLHVRRGELGKARELFERAEVLARGVVARGVRGAWRTRHAGVARDPLVFAAYRHVA